MKQREESPSMALPAVPLHCRRASWLRACGARPQGSERDARRGVPRGCAPAVLSYQKTRRSTGCGVPRGYAPAVMITSEQLAEWFSFFA
jgi:hypothetical protein